MKVVGSIGFSGVLCRCAVLAMVLATGHQCSKREWQPPHIIFITADALRADHLSLNGYSRQTSPFIDAFAKEARHFSNAVTVIPKTGPSFTTVFSGRHPQQHKVQYNPIKVPEELAILPQILKKHGYRTAAFVSNGVLNAERGYTRGYDTYELFTQHDLKHLREAALAFIEQPWEQPTFLWIHIIDPHGPYKPPEEYSHFFEGDPLTRDDTRVPLEYERLESFGPQKVLGALPKYQRLGDEDRVSEFVRRYDAEVRYMDHLFGELIGALKQRRLYQQSAIVFLSDHGESHTEHTYFFEHGWYAYEPTLHIPLIVKTPRESLPGTVIREQVSTLDVLPTVLVLAGMEPGSALAGRFILEPLKEPTPVLIENSNGYPHKYQGIRYRDMKYILDVHSGFEELYDLNADPGELTNLAAEREATLAEYRRLYEELLQKTRNTSVGEPTVVEIEDERILENLKSLGYAE